VGAGRASGTEDSLVGKTGRVTVSVPRNGPGEVLLPVRGGTEAFAALSDEPIPRHSRVVVVEVLSARSVLVTPLPL
jgi:membrane protein implicated in regulation of membrane protease activity